jgi:hypothetical protein
VAAVPGDVSPTPLKKKQTEHTLKYEHIGSQLDVPLLVGGQSALNLSVSGVNHFIFVAVKVLNKFYDRVPETA